MALYNNVIVADTAGPLVDALVEATAMANSEVRLLALERNHWEEFLPELRGKREGRRQWSDAHKGDTARVCISWWTDPIGRRHCRILAGNSRDGSYRQLSAIANDPHPPLWHVHPERVFRRQINDHDDWVVVCGCGLCGDPEGLGWMGTHCAACHDKLEEGQSPGPDLALAGSFRHDVWERPILAFSPNGQWLTTIRAEQPDIADLCLFEVATGEVRQLHTLRDAPYSLAFSGDGRLLAYTEGTNRLLIRDLETDAVELDLGSPFTLLSMAFTPDRQTLATAGNDGLVLYRKEHNGWQLLLRHETPGTAVAFSRNGRRLAIVNSEQLALFDLHLDALVLQAEFQRANNRPARDLAFFDNDRKLVMLASHDGTATAVLGELFQGLPYASELMYFGIDPGNLILEAQHELRGGGMGDLSPDQSHVATVSRNGNVLWITDARSIKPLGQISWNLQKRWCSVALSPDGQTVAVVDSQNGGKLIPWRFLLER